MKQHFILLIALCLLAGIASAAPVAEFSADDTTPDVGQTVIFTDASTDAAQTITNWAWTIEGVEDTDYQYVDATSATTQNPHVQFLVAGTYDVSLRATNDIAEFDDEIKADYITASEVVVAPVAEFSADDETPAVDQTVIFTDASTNTPTSWAWTIEGVENTNFQYVDTTSATSQNPHVQFLVAGTYDVSLTATNDGGSDDEIKTDYITASEAVVAPVAEFSADDETPAVDQTVIFTDASTNTPTSWAWTIEGVENTDYQYVDATSATSQNPHVQFLTAGTYDVSLTATNDGGSDDEIKTDYITASEAVVAPVAEFSADDETPAVDQTVVFTDASTNTPTSWAWTIEGVENTNYQYVDATSATTQNPHVQFLTAGTYDVSLTATNDGGSDAESKNNYITASAVTPAPVASFTTDTPEGDYPAFLVKCTDTSTNTSPISWQWRFTHVTGNNTPVVFSTIRNPYIIFSDDGQYTIRLTVTNAEGSDQSDAASFTINDCSGTSCNRRFYPLFDGSVSNTTEGTWAGTRNAVAGTGSWDGNEYNPIQLLTSTTPGAYANMYKMLTTFDTTVIPYTATVQTADVSYFGFWKNNGLGTFNISLIDANPANPASYVVGDWSRTSYQRQAADITYADWEETGENTFSGVNISYVNKTGITVLGLAFNWTVDDQEPTWASGQSANIYACSIAADVDSDCYGNQPYLEVSYDSTPVLSPPVARYSVIRPDGFFPDMKITFIDTSTNASTAWEWTATNVTGNNTPFTFSTSAEATLTLGAGNWSIRHTASNADGSDTTAPAFFNISECSGTTCSHRFYPSNYATIGNTTNSTWSDKRSAMTANSLQEPGVTWYLPVTMPSSHPEGIYAHWTRALLTFQTSSLNDSVPVTQATVKMWGAGKFNSFASPDASIIDADPSDPGNYVAEDWGRTSYTRLSADVAYADFNITPGEVSFVLNNNSYVERTGNTSFYFTNNFVTDNVEPSTPWVNDQYAYLFYCDANAANPDGCKGLYNALEVSYPSGAGPAVTGIAPASGVRGGLSALATISGNNFGAGARVFLNKTGYPLIEATNVTVISPTSITCTFPIPADAPLGYRNVDVVNLYGGFGTRVNAFMVRAPVAPVVNSVAPAAGTRGTLVTLSNVSGTGFVSGAKVFLLKAGSTTLTATNVTVISPTRIRCTVRIPAGAAIGTWTARVTNADNQVGAKANAFMVRTPVAPVVNSVAPAAGIRGTLVTLSNVSGTGFVTGAKTFLLKAGSPTLTATNVTVISPTRIRCTVRIPAGAVIGSWNVKVTNADKQFGTRINAFNVKTPVAPTVVSLTPATGRRGQLVTITSLTGTGFVATPVPTVQLINGASIITATNVSVINAGRITCSFSIPAGAATGSWSARVINGDKQSGIRAAAFTVNP